MLYANHSIIFRKQMQVKTCLLIFGQKEKKTLSGLLLFLESLENSITNSVN